MAGLLAWAADVVGAGGPNTDQDDPNSIPLIFTPDQQRYVRELDAKASSLSRLIQDLRLRLPPPDISQRLPHLHAHSLASNAVLALQLNAHSATKEQAQQREVMLQEEHSAYEKAISDCENKVQEILQGSDLLRRKLKELDLTEKSLTTKLENVQAAPDAIHSGKLGENLIQSKSNVEAEEDAEASESVLLEKLENKKKELGALEEIARDLEKKWGLIQDNALKQPSRAQREKLLDKQLHSLIEQLAAKQAQAEGLVSEIHLKEMELERLNALSKRLETSVSEVNAARNRFAGSSSEKGFFSSDYIVDPHNKLPYHTGGRFGNLQRQMLLRSAFVLYILAVHILVFIKISF
ncbi:hypothetical protein RJ639_009650 [Escallonia herrerae]|uniref:Uncharacterized protein n=1 Tax=Escallonia herrerae TaxID=1293975 RepID=A0AA89AS61_9ASTE|nr:hypothetical protein RJ639_009650 [Escallonia herrerae]